MKLIPKDPDALKCKIGSKLLIVYGMGYVGKLIAEWCDSQAINYIFADREAFKMKQETQKKVIAPEVISTEYSDANIAIATINYYDEIKSFLSEIGVEDERILPYSLFWPKKIAWNDLEESANWESVRLRTEKYAGWIDETAESVVDYSAEKNFLREFLHLGTKYYSPDYIRFTEEAIVAEFNSEIQADVSSCIGVLMGFVNPEEVIRHICETTKKSIILSYVPVENLPNIDFRRSINYINDFTEIQIIEIVSQKGFSLVKRETDPFDEVHTVYLFEKR